jgi:hypothetical protein
VALVMVVYSWTVKDNIEYLTRVSNQTWEEWTMNQRSGFQAEFECCGFFSPFDRCVHS